MLLSDYRVLDLTDDRGLLCGQILADLGADVIAVEPPGGSPARSRGPYAGDVADPERSLTWWAYARGKRSITLDLDSKDGRDRLRRLVRGADFLVESFPPGHMEALGLGYEALAELNPSLVYVAITPFGQDGPKAGHAATDLTVAAASGPVAVTGDDDRAPLRFGVPQAFLHAGAEAADAALIAHRERMRSGRGQFVDISAQQALAAATQSTILSAAVNAPDTERLRGGVNFGGLRLPLVWAAADGYVSITFLFGAVIGPFTRRLMEWVCEAGFCDEATRDKDWVGYTELLMGGAESPEEYDRVLDAVAAFVRTQTKQHLLEEAMRRRLLIVPVATIPELDASPQFADRGYWLDLEHPDGTRARYPGDLARYSRTPIANRGVAPRVGEHDDALRAEMDGAATRQPAAHGAGTSDDDTGGTALGDLKVVDLTWVVAGPSATRVLADYGATVVKVESTTHVDTARGLSPFHDQTPGADQSALFQNMNAGKRGIVLDLDTQEGRAVLVDLIRWADVLVDSFSPKAMRGWGFDEATLLGINPRLVWISSSLFGQTGPLSMLAGFGTMGAAIAGFNSVVGWPDRDPAMVAAYTDYVAPRFTLAALLAALDHRDRTGEGQHIDCAQAEASLHFLATALLDYSVNGREFARCANRDPQMAPHAIFPAAGDDAWVAIAARDDADWRALAELMGRAELADEARFVDLAARKAHEDELEALIAEWTAERPPEEIESLLQARDVPSHGVQNSTEVVRDPQLIHRGHFVRLPHPVLGEAVVEGSRFRLSRTPARVERAAPTFGQDAFEVLTALAGYAEERVAELAGANVLR